jgi:hypothetical protein
MQNILYNTHIWAVSFIRSLKFLFARVKNFLTLRFENIAHHPSSSTSTTTTSTTSMIYSLRRRHHNGNLLVGV